MDDALKRIIGLSWRTVPAIEANEAILRARRATAMGEEAMSRGQLEAGASAAQENEDDADAPMARAYEIALPAGATLETFARDQLPKLVYHLESIGAHPPHARGVVVCLFAGEDLHFLQAGELLTAVCAELAISSDELVRRYGTGELRTAIRAAPALARPLSSAPALAPASIAPGEPAPAAAPDARPLALPPPDEKR